MVVEKKRIELAIKDIQANALCEDVYFMITKVGWPCVETLNDPRSQFKELVQLLTTAFYGCYINGLGRAVI